MKIKTNELPGAALGFAVKKALGDIGIIVMRDGKWLAYEEGKHRYAEDWSQGGPIIERERINLNDRGDEWQAHYTGNWARFGPTPLIAAMRCFVSSKLGDEVDVPEELTP